MMKLQHFTMITELLQHEYIKQNIVNIGQKQEIYKGIYGKFKLLPAVPKYATHEQIVQWSQHVAAMSMSIDTLSSQLVEKNINCIELKRGDIANYCRIYNEMKVENNPFYFYVGKSNNNQYIPETDDIELDYTV